MRNWQGGSVKQEMICDGEIGDIETYPLGSSLHKVVESENRTITADGKMTNLA